MYRGVTPETKQALKALAAELRISGSLLAELIFQAGLEAVEKKALTLTIQATPTKMMLFPPGEKPGWSYDPNRTKAAERPKEEPRPQPRAWRSTASYQISDDTHLQLKAMAEQNAVGVGLLAEHFLQWGVVACESGQLRLVSKEVGDE